MTDTLYLELGKKSIELLNLSVSQKIQTIKPTIEPVYLTVAGMLLVSISSLVFQYFLTKRIIKADLNKIQKQIETDFDSKNRFDWIQNFRKLTSELIVVTDPLYNKEIDKLKMLSLITQIQIMLQIENEDEKHLLGLTTHLGLISDILKAENGETQVLRIHSEITDCTRKLLKRKQFS